MDKSILNRELVLLIIQYLNEEGFKETAHKLERESGVYFDMSYFEEMLLHGKWVEAENYLSGFTKIGDNRHSTKLFFEMRKQKFLEALDINDREKALDILMQDLKVFSSEHKELYDEMTQLLTYDNIREHASLSTYGDLDSVRKIVAYDLKKVIEANRVFDGKLKYPPFDSQRLRFLLNQSLNWQHLLCKDPLPAPDITTLLVDHVCTQVLNLPLQPEESDSTEKTESDRHLSNHNSDPSTVTDSVPFPTAVTTREATIEGPSVMPLKGKPSQTSNEVTSATANVLPENAVLILKEDSPPVTMDFHPLCQTLLLVGTNIGSIGLWDVTSGGKLFSDNFRIWGIGTSSTSFKGALERDLRVSVKKIKWSPDGSLFGVAFSEHFVQLYSCHAANGVISQHLQVNAHNGSVNDVAFSSINSQLFVITCGDDKKIRVWNAVNGVNCHTFEGHNAPVCSICPHSKENIPFIFSTSTDGKIKAWLYDSMGARVDFNAPGYGYTTLAYSADDKRLFSCGTGQDGNSYLVEWDEGEGYIKRAYKGLKKPCFSAIHFDSTPKGLLAAGDDHMIKIWNMDNVELWKTIAFDDDFLENPCIRFNKKGALLAVAAKDNKIHVLAIDGILLRTKEIDLIQEPSNLHGTFENGDQNGLENGRSNSTEDSHDKSNLRNVSEIFEPSQCQFLQLPIHPRMSKIMRLAYTNAGSGIVALTSTGDHLVWKWPQSDLNLDGKATAQVSPVIWQPKSGLQLLNKLPTSNIGDPASCLSISKNDSYMMSTSGGGISLFNMVNFKTLANMLPPPPMATCLAIYPRDNNILAVGTDDSSIVIYDVRSNEILNKLEGHSARVTSVAFSSNSDLLVSGDMNAQIFVWNVNGWEKQIDMYLQINGEMLAEGLSETKIQFHPNLMRFLVVRNNHLAIYEATDLRCVNQWVPEVSVDVVDVFQATFSSDGQGVYASFADGTVAVFDTLNFQMRCRISPSAYLPVAPGSIMTPVAIAAHPEKPSQFAVGLLDGRVFVFEPKPDEDWSRLTHDDNVANNNTIVIAG